MEFIYKITNLINSKFYIGKTKNVNARWSQHKSCIGNPKYDTPLYRAMLKYGIENFTIEIVDQADSDYINELEIKWISDTKSDIIGYNITVGGTGGDTFSNKSDVDKSNKRKLHSDIMKKIRANPIINEKYINATKKTHTTEEFRKKMSNVMSESHSRLEVKEKLSSYFKKAKWNGYVCVMDTNGNMQKYNSAHHAARELKMNPHSIINHCKNNTSPTKGVNKNFQFYFEK
jgi:group I intron endonuclease